MSDYLDFVNQVKKLKKCGLKIEILDENKLKKLPSFIN